MIKHKAPYHKRISHKPEGIICPKCGNIDISNSGYQKMVSGEKKQRYWCNICDLHFVLRDLKVTP